MAFLFNVDDKVVFPNAETLLIEPFKSIWERDKSDEKHLALSEFAYIEFTSSMKKSNPYKDYAEEVKAVKVKEAVITKEDWEPDELIEKAVLKIKTFQTEASKTYSFYISAKRAAEKMEEFFNEVDINERNFKTGTPIYKPRDITSALNDTEKVLTNLQSLKKKVEEELYEGIKNRSDKKISPFANPESLNL